MVNTCTLQWKYKPCFESPENSVPRLRKPRYRNRHNGSERSRDLHTCQRKPRPGRILDWKTNCTTRLEMFMIAFFKIVFACLKVRRPKYTQIIRVTRSAAFSSSWEGETPTQESGDLLDFSPHGAQQVFAFSECSDVGPRLLELMRVVLQDVPVSLERVQQRGARWVERDVLCVLNHAIVHLGQLKAEEEQVRCWNTGKQSFTCISSERNRCVETLESNRSPGSAESREVQVICWNTGK